MSRRHEALRADEGHSARNAERTRRWPRPYVEVPTAGAVRRRGWGANSGDGAAHIGRRRPAIERTGCRAEADLPRRVAVNRSALEQSRRTREQPGGTAV